MAVEVDYLDHLSDLLRSGDTAGVKSLLHEEQFEQFLKENAHNVIPIASDYLNKEVMKNSPAQLRCSEKLIKKCAELGHTRECLIEFQAQIESLDETKFQMLLKPIQTTLLRVSKRKGPLMLCVVNVVYSFINSLPLPHYYHVDKNSKLLLDCDENVQRITDYYHLIVEFYDPLVSEAYGQCPADSILRSVLLQGLFHLLGTPLVYLDLEYAEKGSSALHMLSSKIVKLILKLKIDPLQFLRFVEDRDFISVNDEKLLVKEYSTKEIKFSDLSLSVFFYLIFSEHLCDSVPLVYDIYFVVQNTLTLAVTLLRYKETMILRKGMQLTKTVIDKVESNSIQFFSLACDTYKQIIEHLSTVAIYHEVEENRKFAVELIQKKFSLFEPKAQYYVLLNIGCSDIHPILFGFWTTVLTRIVRDSFVSDKWKEYFTGKRLFDLLNIYCSVKKGAETDLILFKDQIISALNLIIFLTRRDKRNMTGVWNYISCLSKTFLTPLREGLDLSRAHYKLELKTLDDPSEVTNKEELSVTVSGKEQSNLSVEEKKSSLLSGLTVFDLIEHILSRVNECIEDIPVFED